MSAPHFFTDEARQTDIVTYLDKLGYYNDYWYLSPLREEKQASFNVNRKLNAWCDYRLGKGGNIIDFGIQYHRRSIPVLIEKLSESLSFHRQTFSIQ